MNLVTAEGDEIKSEPKIILTKEITLRVDIFDNNTMIPHISADPEMQEPELHYWLCKFAQMVLK